MKIVFQWSIILAATAFLAGCANESSSVLSGLTPVTPAYAGGADGQDPTRKTLASKVLTAIALERVTGRKPDPSRLTELN